MNKFLVFVLCILSLFSSSLAQVDEDDGYYLFPDTKAFESSKQISKITVINCQYRMVLDRGGTVFLTGQTNKLEPGTYTGNMLSEESGGRNPFFESLAYLIEKMGVMRLPESIKGNGFDFCVNSFEIVSGGLTKKVTVQPDAFVPELAALSALVSRVLELEFKPFLPVSALNNIRLDQIARIPPKGRVQDKELSRIKTIEYLVAVGKPSIPWLIGQLDDETKIDHHVMDFWYQVHVGDVALIVLSDLFLDRKHGTTIPGFGWDEFLERKSPNEMSEAVLRDYIAKYGRSKIKARWQEVWDKHGDRIEWDWECYCFRMQENE